MTLTPRGSVSRISCCVLGKSGAYPESRKTAAYRRQGAGMLPLQTPDGLPGFSYALRRDRAGVHEDHVGFILRRLEAPLLQHGFDSLRLVLIHFAPQGVRHIFHGSCIFFPYRL